MDLKSIGALILLGWAVVYGFLILLVIVAKRSYIDLVVSFGFLLISGALLNVIHPLLGSGLITIFPIVGGLVSLVRRDQ